MNASRQIRVRILNSYFVILNRSDQYHRVGGDRLAAADGVHSLVGLALDADAFDPDPERGRNARAHRTDVIPDLRPLENHRDVDVADLEALRGDQRGRALQQIETR